MDPRSSPLSGSQLPRSICVFGTFYPEFHFAGNSTTGLAFLFHEIAPRMRVHIVAPIASELPPGMSSGTATLHRIWQSDSPLGLIRALVMMTALSRSVDGYLFNIYVTAFGRTRLANALGLMLPSILRILTGRRVVVYMHNFLETQDVRSLGYGPTRMERLGVRLLEKVLTRTTTVLVPLPSQQRILLDVLGAPTSVAPIPFVEVAPWLEGRQRSDRNGARDLDRDGLRVLLVGSWGPQKDLEGILTLLRSEIERGRRITTVIAGEPNIHFPDYGRQMAELLRSTDPRTFRILGRVSDPELVRLMTNNDVLLLPYNAAGGYSGALNFAAAFPISVIAYDVPQLREQADQLGLAPIFVRKRDPEAFAEALDQVQSRIRSRAIPALSITGALETARSSAWKILGYLH
jgi:glycosyltransferase involved in cell wall biosynthesis